MAERWLVISNCQTFGLANSLRLLNPDISVVDMDLWTYWRDVPTHTAELSSYDRIVVHPHVGRNTEIDLAAMPNAIVVPSIEFHAYHPDSMFLTADGVLLNGPITAYHSMIARAAFDAGMSVSDTIRLYVARTYEACGYFDFWVPHRDNFVGVFRNFGFDLASLVRRWSRGTSFMHTGDHPRIDVLYDLAGLVTARAGRRPVVGQARPSDNLANGPCLPVYPEIGEKLGVAGSYLFKLNGQYRYIDLEEFVSLSFATYEQHRHAEIGFFDVHNARYRHVRTALEGLSA